MANLEEVKRKLAQLSEKGKGTPKGGWKPSDEHTVRLLDMPGRDDPFVERSYHSNIGEAQRIRCPGPGCPICAFADDLRSWNDRDGVEKPEERRKREFEVFKKIQAVPRFLVAMVERGKEADGAKIWSMTDKVHTDLLKVCANEDWNEGRADGGGTKILTSPTEGLDISVSFQKPGAKGNQTKFTLIVVSERKKMTKLAQDPAEAKRIADSIPDIDVVDPPVSLEDVTRAFEAFVGSASKVVEGGKAASAGTEVGGKAKAAPNSAEKLDTGKRSIDDAFKDLLKDKGKAK